MVNQRQRAEPAGVAVGMPGAFGFTMAVFKASDVPAGTELYAAPVEAERFREHSVLLNRILWQMLEVLGDAEPGAGELVADPEETVQGFFAAVRARSASGEQSSTACAHAWTEESESNGWRSHCRLCGARAQGSGQ
jgi:hypothetical protein